MQSWASEELRYVQLGDARLNRRLVKMVETFAGNPESSVPKAPEPAMNSGTILE